MNRRGLGLKRRLPLVLSVTALAIAVLGSTPARHLTEPTAVRQSFPFTGNSSGWFGNAYETTPTSENWSLFVYAICVNVSS